MPDDIVSRLRDSLGDGSVLAGDLAQGREPVWQTHQPCLAKALVLPRTTQQVAEILRLCNEAGQSIVPYGGITNLVQACATTPDDVALSLERLDQIEEIDATAHTMTAQAGVTMQNAQQAAENAGLYFPVDIGARDSCMLGGNVATNAGGTKVIRYGMMRDSILGLEAVLADGTLISSMNRFIKNNSGFDLKQLFIGTEGLLGIITRIVVRLSVRPKTHNVALVACSDFARGGGAAESFEGNARRQPVWVRGDVGKFLSQGGPAGRSSRVAIRRKTPSVRDRGVHGHQSGNR